MKEYIRKSKNSLGILIDGDPSPYKLDERTIDRKIQSKRVQFDGIGNPKYISDIIKMDVDNIMLYKKSVVRPIIAGFGNGKTNTTNQAIYTILKKQLNVIIVKIDMSDFAGVERQDDILSGIFYRIVDDNKDKLHKILEEMNREERLDIWLKNVRFPSMKKGLKKIAKNDDDSKEEGRLIITGREFNITFSREELLSNFMSVLELFNYKQYLIVMIYDELEAFMDQSSRNLDVIKFFLELFIKKLISPNSKLQYLYILFTCENESYEKLFLYSKPTGHRLRNKQIILFKMEIDEIYELANKIYDTHPHLKDEGVLRPTKKDCDNIIKKMEKKIEYNDTRSFIQKLAIKLNNDYLSSSHPVQITEKYEIKAFEEWKKIMIEWGCSEKDINRRYTDKKFKINWDGHAEKRTIGDKLVGIGFMEATITNVDTTKADDFIRKINVYRGRGLFDPNKDKAILIAPRFESKIPQYLKRNNIEIIITNISEEDKNKHRRPYQEKPKENPKEKPKENPKEKPKEEPKEKPKEEPKEKPKEDILDKYFREQKNVKGLKWDPDNKTPEMKRFEKDTGKNAIIRGKITGGFDAWFIWRKPVEGYKRF